MRTSLLSIFGITLLTFPGILQASRIDDFDYTTSEKVNLKALFSDEEYLDFLVEYDLSNGDALTFFQDPDIQKVLTQIRKSNLDSKAIKALFKTIDKNIGINDRTEGVLSKSKKFSLSELLEAVDFLSDTSTQKDSTHHSASSSSSAIDPILDIIQGETDPSSETSLNYKKNRGPVQEYVTTYTTLNCKQYRIIYLPNQEAYTSPDFLQPAYFISVEHLERYIDTKNPGTCNPKQNYTLNSVFDNQSKLRYIAPNGKIYYTDIAQQGNWYSNEMNPSKFYYNLGMLQDQIRNGNPQIQIKGSL